MKLAFHVALLFSFSCSFGQTADHSRFEQLLKAYRSHELPMIEVPGLINKARGYRETALADSMTADYVKSYLLRLPEDSLQLRPVLDRFMHYNESSYNKGFQWIWLHAAAVDSILMKKGAAMRYVDYIIARDEVDSKLWQNLDITRPLKGEPMWDTYHDNIARRFNTDVADRIVINAQFRWALFRKDSAQMLQAFMTRCEKYGISTSGIQAVTDNNDVFNLLFKRSFDKSQLKKGAQWMEQIIAANPQDADFIDTYANLLYKLGLKEQALQWEAKALGFAKNKQAIQATYEKMQQGVPTWPVK